MKITRDEIRDRQTTLHIEVDDETKAKHMKQAHSKVANSLNIPGFRKGKAPQQIVEQYYGKERMLMLALETLLPDVVDAAIEEEKLEKSSTPQVSILKHSPNLQLDVTVPLAPIVDIGEYMYITLDNEIPKVSEKDIDDAFQKLREARASWLEYDGAVQLGDLVTINSRGVVKDEIIVNQENTQYLASHDNSYPLPGFPQQLEGMTPGEKRDFILTVPDGYSREDLIGENMQFEVSLESVRRKSLPELDEDFMKSLGHKEFSSAEELREYIRDTLQDEADSEYKSTLDQKAVEALVDCAEFDIPPLMIENEAAHMLEHQKETMAKQNIEYEDYLKRNNLTVEDMNQRAKEVASTRLKRSLAIQEFIKVEEIEVSDDSVEEAFQRQAKAGGDESEKESSEEIKQKLIWNAAISKAVEIMTTQSREDDANSSPL